jgi:type II secretory pathway pseudopilin PulG
MKTKIRNSSAFLGILNHQKGYFLLELLVTAVILAGGILFIIDSIRTPYKVMRQSLATEQALALATDVFNHFIMDSASIVESKDNRLQIGNIEYKWKLQRVYSLPINRFSDEIWLYILKINWNDTREYSIELPFLWRYQLNI